MVRRTTPHVSEAAAAYVRLRRPEDKIHKNHYTLSSLLRRFATFTRDVQVASLQPHHVEDFFYGVGGLSDTCQPTTLARYRADLHAFFKWCKRRGYMTRLPEDMMEGVRERNTRADKERARWTATELLTFFDAAKDQRDRGLAVMVGNTGLRISDTCMLRVGHVDLDKGWIRARIVKTRKERLKPITAELDSELRRWFVHYQTEVGAPLEPDWYLFPARHHNRLGTHEAIGHNALNPVMRLSNPNRVFHLIKAESGLSVPKGEAWHLLRRSVGRIYFDSCLDAGLPFDSALLETMTFLDHSTVAQTLVYLGVSKERLMIEARLKGKSFLTQRAADRSNVTPIAARG